MSLGVWGFTLFGMVCTLDALVQIASDLQTRQGQEPRVLQRYLGLASAGAAVLPGLFVAGYTGVLLAATAVPLWGKQPRLLGPLFLSSAMSSGSAAIVAVSSTLMPVGRAGESRLQRLEAILTLAEGAVLLAWVCSLGTTARPITSGRLGGVLRHGVGGVGIALPLVVAAVAEQLPAKLQRQASLISSLLTLSGVFALRYVVVEGGRLSADDPRATFDLTG
jgi:formate-dependent nitrite reductase membrane component NrfD